MDWTDSGLWTWVGLPLLIFLARLTDVSLGTVRIILVARGMRRLAPFIGFFEVLVWLAAITQVMQHLDRPLSYVAYAAGFATGTYVGIRFEERLGLGLLAVRVITEEDASGLIEQLRAARFGVTSFAARGLRGRVRLFFTVIHRKHLDRVMEIVRRAQPAAFVSVSDVRMAEEGTIPPRGGLLRRMFGGLRK